MDKGDIKKGILFTGLFVGLLLGYNALVENLPLTEEDGRILLDIADRGLHEETYEGGIPLKLSRKAPLFLSVYQENKRVSCIGYTKPYFTLQQSVDRLSESTEFDKSKDYSLAVTVFGDYQPLEKYGLIPSNHGVLVTKNGTEGAVLPQSFTEYGLDDNLALDLAAWKAGFESFTWDEFTVYVFEADVFTQSNSMNDSLIP